MKTKTKVFSYPIVIRIRPIQTAQTFSIIPSSYAAADLDAASITFVENGTDIADSSPSFTWVESANTNFIEVTFTPSLTLKEGQIYTLTIKSDTDIYYRDLVYITSETSKKDVFTLPDNYDEYNPGKTEYIVI